MYRIVNHFCTQLQGWETINKWQLLKLTEISDNKLNKSVNFRIGNIRNEPFMKKIKKWGKFH